MRPTSLTGGGQEHLRCIGEPELKKATRRVSQRRGGAEVDDVNKVLQRILCVRRRTELVADAFIRADVKVGVSMHLPRRGVGAHRFAIQRDDLLR